MPAKVPKLRLMAIALLSLVAIVAMQGSVLAQRGGGRIGGGGGRVGGGRPPSSAPARTQPERPARPDVDKSHDRPTESRPSGDLERQATREMPRTRPDEARQRPAHGNVVNRPGVFVASLAASAVVVSAANAHYYYDYGAWYLPSYGGYTVATAPVGATVADIPSEAEEVVVNEDVTNYYYGGTYYQKSGDGYEVVPPTAGTVVSELPEGGEEVTIADQKYVKFGETYYRPIEKDGKRMYQVVDVRTE